MQPAIALALLAGVLGAVQPRVNAELAGRLDNDVVAAATNFVIAMVLGWCLLAARSSVSVLAPSRVRAWGVPWWTFLGGFGGALAVLSGVVAVEEVGVATFSVAFFAGQVASGLVVDAFGLAPGGRRPVTARRAVGSTVALAAVVIAQIGRPAGEVEPALVAFVVFAGLTVSIQSAGNARIARASGDAVAATALNSTIGTLGLLAVVAVGAASGGDASLTWPSAPWLYLGGLLGVGIVLSLAVATVTLGVLESTLAVVAAQLTAAFVVDAVVDGATPRAGAVIGSIVLLGAVALLRGQVRESTTGR